MVKNVNKPVTSSKPTSPSLPKEYRGVVDNFANIFGTKVNIKVNEKGKGIINIPFGSTEELNRIIEIIEER